ncbi:hypothetical protein O181_000083 [Austropuccinia psidii MF-1]|uniref:Integrase catalytic domain-containing protein n=1 Tax=Austropuccinia psidii MF-1 TaxID=1389203 RepID=A0A9Q3B7W8_9BASI|nr:hypothetical protein [Austropuccinia psidii MF-1]
MDPYASSHSEANEKTERVNQILKQYPLMYVSYHQDYWNTRIPLYSFAYNNSDNLSTKHSPFSTVHGRDPQFNSFHISQNTPAGKLSSKINPVQKDVKRELKVAIKGFKRYVDKIKSTCFEYW